MQIKSWQISFLGILIPLLAILLLYIGTPKGKMYDDQAMMVVASFLFFIFLVVVSLIPTLFLFFNKTKKLGAILSIFFSIVLLIFFSVFF